VHDAYLFEVKSRPNPNILATSTRHASLSRLRKRSDRSMQAAARWSTG